MKKNSIIFMSLFALLLLLSSCASSKIRGANPVQRAYSAAHLLNTGSIGNSYIKQFNIEMEKAEIDIQGKVSKVAINPEAYEKIADAINDWIQLYDEIALLQSRYPQGLFGKKHSAFFTYIDYRPLKEKANLYTAENYFNKAKDIAEKPHEINDAILALDYLHKSLTYSDHLLKETKEIGASLSYKTAQALNEIKTSENLKKAYSYFLEADKWIFDYKDAKIRAFALQPEIAELLIKDGNALLVFEDYVRLRKAFLIYEEAYSYAPAIAEKKLKETKDKLSITVALVFSGPNASFINNAKIRNEIETYIANSNEGPLFAEIDFIHTPYTQANYASFLSSIVAALKTQSLALKKNYKTYDLLLLPGPNFNTVVERIENPKKETENLAKYYRQTITRKENTSETKVIEVSRNEFTKPKTNYIDNDVSYEFSYWKEEGIITRYTQKVSLFMDYSFELYDIRNNFVTFLQSFDRTGEALELEFIQESYLGANTIQPEKLRNDTFYQAGQHIWYSYKIPTLINPYQIIDSTYDYLNENGKKLTRQIQRLNYMPR